MNKRILKFGAIILVFSILGTGCKKEEPDELINPAETLTNRFFYAFGEKIFLIEKPYTLTVKFFEDVDAESKENYFNLLASIVNVKWHNSDVAEIAFKDDNSKREMMTKLFDMKEVKVSVPFYTDTAGIDLGYTDELLIAFNPGVGSEEQNRLHKKYQVSVIKTTNIYQKLVVPKGIDALEVANRYYETGLLKFSQPNFLSYPVAY